MKVTIYNERVSGDWETRLDKDRIPSHLKLSKWTGLMNLALNTGFLVFYLQQFKKDLSGGLVEKKGEQPIALN